MAAATVAGPHLLLLDEPTANLDPESAAEVLAAVEAVRTAHGCTVVVIEHRVEAWLARADRVLLAEDGTILDLMPAELAGAPGPPARRRGTGLGRPRAPAQPSAPAASPVASRWGSRASRWPAGCRPPTSPPATGRWSP